MSVVEEERMDGEERKKGFACPAPARKKRRLLLILFVPVLVIGFSFYLLYSNSSGSGVRSCHASSSRFPAKDGRNQGDVLSIGKTSSYICLLGKSFNGISGYLKKEQCDLFFDEWVCDPYGPVYTNNSCNFIEAPQNCMRNGRSDVDFLYCRWRSYGCKLPRFDPFKCINAMKNKSWAFIGDSIFRNHIQSMLCLLSMVDEPVEIYHDKPYKSKTWYFGGHNLTIAVIWSPFMIKSETFEDDDGKSKAQVQIYLDILEQKWASQYNKYDYIIFSGWQWFLKTMVMWENNSIGCHNCNDKSLKELGVDYPYRKALQMCYDFMASSEHKPLIFFRTWTPDHFEHGVWFSGGVCNRTSPYGEGEYNGKPMDHEMRAMEVEEFEKATKKGGARLKLLDTFYLSLLRPDGHPGPYRTFHPFAKSKKAQVQNDCLHWCLPGPIDAWNDLIMKILADEGVIKI